MSKCEFCGGATPCVYYRCHEAIRPAVARAALVAALEVACVWFEGLEHEAGARPPRMNA